MNDLVRIICIQLTGSPMWVRHSDHVDLLDDGSTSSTRYKFDSGSRITSFWHNGNQCRMHCIHEGIFIINDCIQIYLL